jgi:predicted CoA-binding protein
MNRINIRITPILFVLAVSLTANFYSAIHIKNLKREASTHMTENVYQVSTPDTLSDWNTLQLAIAMTESEFNPKAVGKTNDYGIYQITPIYVKEINRLLGEQVYTHNQAFDIEKSVEMFNIMQSFKNPNQDIETAIYFHNKAPWYKKKVLRNYETVKRYETLRSILQENI